MTLSLYENLTHQGQPCNLESMVSIYDPQIPFELVFCKVTLHGLPEREPIASIKKGIEYIDNGIQTVSKRISEIMESMQQLMQQPAQEYHCTILSEEEARAIWSVI